MKYTNKQKKGVFMKKKRFMSPGWYRALVMEQKAVELLLEVGGMYSHYNFCRLMRERLGIANNRSACVILDVLIGYEMVQTDGLDLWLTAKKPDVFSVLAERHHDELYWRKESESQGLRPRLLYGKRYRKRVIK